MFLQTNCSLIQISHCMSVLNVVIEKVFIAFVIAIFKKSYKLSIKFQNDAQ